MDKFSKRKRAEQDMKNKPMDAIPKTCGRCDKTADLLFIRVYNQATGEHEVGYFSGSNKQRAYGRHDPRTGELSMVDGFIFKNWIARCADCFTEDCEKDRQMKAAREGS